jgi:hypothetical protein
MRKTMLQNTLLALGFGRDNVDKLRRASLTLRRWSELKCGIDGGAIERDETTGRPYWVDYNGAKARRRPIADRENGALRRIQRIVDGCNEFRAANGDPPLSTYIQSYPRGGALYVIRPGDIPKGSTVDSCYTRGICVY